MNRFRCLGFALAGSLLCALTASAQQDELKAILRKSIDAHGGEKLMAKVDVDWMAKNRDRILAEWTKRYDGKSAPKAK